MRATTPPISSGSTLDRQLDLLAGHLRQAVFERLGLFRRQRRGARDVGAHDVLVRRAAARDTTRPDRAGDSSLPAVGQQRQQLASPAPRAPILSATASISAVRAASVTPARSARAPGPGCSCIIAAMACEVAVDLRQVGLLRERDIEQRLGVAVGRGSQLTSVRSSSPASR